MNHWFRRLRGGRRENASMNTSSCHMESGFCRFLAVFDFDLTLTTFHVWGRYRNTPLEEIPMEKSVFVDLEAFRYFVHEARNRDAKIAIATFGRRDVVNKALCFVLGEEHGIVISTPADHFDPRFEFADEEDRPRCVEGTDVLGDKNTQLDYLCQYFQVPKSLVFLADDDADNVAAARQFGIFAQHTPDGAHKAILDSLLARIPPIPLNKQVQK
uniref:FCP1 homology domain-containing protein n=1 Tax=Aureoumbra lagunensis TaxID=44058 RepID=A0A7S3NP38_9STRA|mmetsp:Transcript_8984/g.13821  ORF Transcript_8984/g.13821 Transcript_8984/m.13821 type:complete len:214 (+) Transcript_8984:53-694(+)